MINDVNQALMPSIPLHRTMLSEGDTAPDFTATIQDGSSFNLQTALEDSGVILYFYPKDSTPGCTTQACDFRDAKDTFESAGWRVIGVSRDSEVSHQRFIDAQSLNFDLIVDNDTSLHELYGAWGEKTNYGKTYMGAIRSTFVISQEQTILWAGRNVRAKGHVERVLKELDLE
tara:strand:- start:169 stop:687 length:519 start_codon:yes stop_codon:yes gene_type:complete